MDGGSIFETWWHAGFVECWAGQKIIVMGQDIVQKGCAPMQSTLYASIVGSAPPHPNPLHFIPQQTSCQGSSTLCHDSHLPLHGRPTRPLMPGNT
jgi:hypothetical protein